ncbi:fluoride efflux transporter CrcB [Desulfallas thermosapovorans]|uniref:Fluoride-specific ion channel FluC n=1 Tax=Desulfallas thermosapovorans DSM 6562 TaxID=1121431 RepID=A0A5S4ZR41_9FIRM|nr:fluoride efflux transporter CrcB [Desulfallas thermosapovorans]TYO95294.1 CrcB protein [Desulfallas thermosapovorans DSM 6562]
MTNTVLVGIGGFLGACCRYLAGRLINRYWKNSFPMATFIVNVTGSFLLGLLILHPGLFQKFPGIELIFGLGFLGAFTTFSTFEFEVLQLFEKRKYTVAALYVILSFSLGFGLARAAA